MQMRTNTLRALLERELKAIGDGYGAPVSYKEAYDRDMYPHIVYDLTGSDLTDLTRKDYTLDVNIWTKNDPVILQDIADDVEDLLCNRNDPQDEILPTFFTVTRAELDDPDKSVGHIVIRAEVQMYDH